MFRRLVGLAGGLLLLSTSWATAQETILGQMYGAGVHAYYSNDYYRAHEQFSSAITAGCQDPRCYYYRGLCLTRMGRPEEAQADFEMGARLETADVNHFYNVPAALQRIQGHDRLTVERFRTQARMTALQRERELRAARYGEQRQEEQRVLLQQAEAAPAAPPAMTAQPSAVGAFQTGPIDEPVMEQPAAPAAPAVAEEKPAQAAPPAANPFAAPAADDPFAAKPATEEKAEAKPAAAADDPFGMATEKPAKEEEKAEPAEEKKDEAADDPFGAMTTEAKDDKAEAKEEKAAENNPFGNMDADKPAEEKEKPEAAKVDNPFADEAPAGGMKEAPAQKAEEEKAEEKEEKKDEAAGGAMPADPFAQ